MAGPKTDRRQQHGEVSRKRILDAAVEIAAERGYEGTSMSLVRQRSGLPNSSIYWHFKDKDDLFAAVIERGYHLWRDRLMAAWRDRPATADRAAASRAMAAAIAASLQDQPEFLRLGLMLTLENRPVETKARERFVAIRGEVLAFARTEFLAVLDEVPEARRDEVATHLATFTLAAADGLFLAYHLAPDTFDLAAGFAELGETLDLSIDRWIARTRT
ncbi:TetR/AcrR family transcriptional regulator [Actinomadura parmotrematis]|uniref:TetR/AcrR family transcriptional regulator n=1 Tax=Actinomadura parmotrematis TaxID=2864039 RepID=A0ABS7FTU8_9ACTN|nr:TetR/AcrR family transcriptional regulator [Actinomadura parmotrematis]MBW8483159.1 TetR/AcrR family transcriptional regulator [Actinomadura parmotrematis]